MGMKIDVSPQSAQYVMREFNIRPGDSVRIFVRYGGSPQFQPGFSLGIGIEQPKEIAASTETNGIQFFIRESDLWYFDGQDLSIDYNPREDGLDFIIHPPQTTEKAH